MLIFRENIDIYTLPIGIENAYFVLVNNRKIDKICYFTCLTISSYSLSVPFDSFHRRYITDASTLAGENVFGSFNNEITLRRIVLQI